MNCISRLCPGAQRAPQENVTSPLFETVRVIALIVGTLMIALGPLLYGLGVMKIGLAIMMSGSGVLLCVLAILSTTKREAIQEEREEREVSLELHAAVDGLDVPEVRRLLEQKVPLVRNGDGETPFFLGVAILSDPLFYIGFSVCMPDSLEPQFNNGLEILKLLRAYSGSDKSRELGPKGQSPIEYVKGMRGQIPEPFYTRLVEALGT